MTHSKQNSGVSDFAHELARVARHWRTRLDAEFRTLGLTQARWRTLLELSKAGPVTQRDLAQSLGIEGPTLVRMLDGLEAQGLIERKACDEDRRAKRVYLTEAAAPLLTKMRGMADTIRNDLLVDIPAGDLAVARQVLATIAQRLEKP